MHAIAYSVLFLPCIVGPSSGTLLVATPMKPLLHSSVSSGYHSTPNLEALTGVLKHFPSWKYTNSANRLNVYRIHDEESETEGQPPVAISHVIVITIADVSVAALDLGSDGC